jgi:hypothetical protein
MLVRVSSGAGGIVTYLQTGRNRGREHTRDEIDERLVLSGDLALAEALIDSIETTTEGAARYLHITLGFSETYTALLDAGPGEVNLARLAEITEAYRQLLMAAYDPREYAWYAEAHVPKVTHGLHAASGELVERLTHVHIVVPMRNLEDGKYLNPFGHYLSNEHYAQALQETLNARFGLLSPLESPRSEGTDPLLRHNPAIAPLQQPPTSRAKKTPVPEPGFSELAAQWRQRAAFEARYVNAGNRRGFKRLAAPQRMQWLDAKAAATRERLDAHDARWPPAHTQTPEETHGPARFTANFARARDAWRAAHLLQSPARATAGGPTADTLAGVRDLPDVDLVQDRATDEVLLHPHAPGDLGRKGTAPDAMRRPGTGPGGSGRAPGRRRPLTVAQTLSLARRATQASPDLLKASASPTLVIEAAARKFGIDPAAYAVGPGSDGTPRILHAGHQYNLGDFFTKHLKRPWSEALPVLTSCYHATLADALPPPDKRLWKAYRSWLSRHAADRRAALATRREATSAALAAARAAWQQSRATARRLPKEARHKALAIARAEYISRTQRIAAQRRDDAPLPLPSTTSARYRLFLTTLASHGNLAALAELRRCTHVQPREPNAVTGHGPGETALPHPLYSVDANGRVTYLLAGQAAVADHRAGVSVLAATDRAYDLALRVALTRYGPSLVLEGDAAFVQAIHAAARRSNLRLSLAVASRPEAVAHIAPMRSR